MKITINVEIPDGKFCNKCPCFLNQLDSYEYEVSHNWCFYLKTDLNEALHFNGRKTKKPLGCPAYKDDYWIMEKIIG